MSKIKKYFVENKKVVFLNKKDPVFDSWFLNKFINSFTTDGNKVKIEKVILKCFSLIKYKYKRNPLITYLIILQKIKPLITIKFIGFGNKRFSIPIPLSTIKQYKLSIKFIVNSIKQRKERTLKDKIILEFNNILEDKPNDSIVKRDILYSQARRNRYLINFFN